MDRSFDHAQRVGRRIFVVGWFFSLLNLFGMVVAVYAVFRLYTFFDPSNVFSTLEDGVSEALTYNLVVGGFAALSLFQFWFLAFLAKKMKADIPETESAEAALKIARYSAAICLAFCVLSLAIITRRYRQWADLLRVAG
jgi:hypothetical protein